MCNIGVYVWSALFLDLKTKFSFSYEFVIDLYFKYVSVSTNVHENLKISGVYNGFI